MTEKLLLAALELVLVQLYRVFEFRLNDRKSVQRFEQVIFGDYSKRCVVPRENSGGASWIGQNCDFSEVLTLVERTHEHLLLFLVANIHIAVPSRNYVEVRTQLALADDSHFGLLHHHSDVVDQNLLEWRLVFKHRVLFDGSWEYEVNHFIFQRSWDVIKKCVQFILLFKGELNVAQISNDSALNVWWHLFDLHRRVGRVDDLLEFLGSLVHVKDQQSHVTKNGCVHHSAKHHRADHKKYLVIAKRVDIVTCEHQYCVVKTHVVLEVARFGVKVKTVVVGDLIGYPLTFDLNEVKPGAANTMHIQSDKKDKLEKF